MAVRDSHDEGKKAQKKEKNSLILKYNLVMINEDYKTIEEKWINLCLVICLFFSGNVHFTL